MRRLQRRQASLAAGGGGTDPVALYAALSRPSPSPSPPPRNNVNYNSNRTVTLSPTPAPRNANTNRAPWTLTLEQDELMKRAGGSLQTVAGWVLNEVAYAGQAVIKPATLAQLQAYAAANAIDNPERAKQQLRRTRRQVRDGLQRRRASTQQPMRAVTPNAATNRINTYESYTLKYVDDASKKNRAVKCGMVLARVRQSGYPARQDVLNKLRTCTATDAQIERALKEARMHRFERRAAGPVEANAAVAARVTGNIFARVRAADEWTRERVPDATGPDFQQWLLRAFQTRHHLLRNVRTRTGSVHGNLSTPRNAKDDPCAADPTPRTAAIMANQAVVSLMARLRAAGRIDTSGLLVMHSTGGGKTLIGLAVLLAFWDKKTSRGEPYPVVFVSTNDNQTNNDASKLAELALRFFPDWTTQAGERPWATKGQEWREPAVVERAAARIRARLRQGNHALMAGGNRARGATQQGRELYTYAKLGNDLRDGYVPAAPREAVFVVDEIQYLIAPPPTEQAYAREYARVQDMLAARRDPKSTWCVGMTATPGETKDELVRIMNAVMGPLPQQRRMAAGDDLAALAAKARGYVSYAYLLGDNSRFAPFTLRLQCSYLKDSYYHDLYLRRLLATHGANPDFAAIGKRFVEAYAPVRVDGEGRSNLRVKKPPSDADRNTDRYRALWTYAADNPARTAVYLQHLKNLTLYMLLSRDELLYLRRRYDPTYENYDNADNSNNDEAPGPSSRRRRTVKWPIRELIVMTTSEAAAQRRDRNDENADAVDDENGNVQRNETDANYQARTTDAANRRTQPRRQAAPERATKVWRFLLSPKIPQLLNFVYRDLEFGRTAGTGMAKGIHFVYTSNPTAALLVAHSLRKVLNMAQLKDAAAAARPGARAPYFAMINTVASNRQDLRQYRTTQTQVKELMKLIDSDANATGDIVKVVIATTKSFKGVDLKHLRYLHLLDPFVNFRDFVQFVGRGPRNCSHRKLPVHKRKVDVILYRLAYSPDHDCATAKAALADCFLLNESFRRYTQPGGFKSLEDEVLWKSSVDYLLFKDNLHANRDALYKMVTDLRCETAAAGTTSNFGNLLKSTAEARQRVARTRLQANKEASNLRAMMREYARAAKTNAAAARNRYPDAMGMIRLKDQAQSVAKARKDLRDKPNDEQLQRRVAAAQNVLNGLRAKFPRQARLLNHLQALQTEQQWGRNAERDLNVWTESLRVASENDGT